MKKNKQKKINDGYEEHLDDLGPEDLRDPIIVHEGPLLSAKQLAESLKKIRITIQMDFKTVLFFKQQADKHHVGYQAMIRQALKSYMEHLQAKRAA